MLKRSTQKHKSNSHKEIWKSIAAVQGRKVEELQKSVSNDLFPVTAELVSATEEARKEAEAKMLALIGTPYVDGWKHAGISPETNKPFYIRDIDTGIVSWATVELIVDRGEAGRRVPTEKELKHIFKYRSEIGCFHPDFGHPAGWYWTATPGKNSEDNQCCVSFANGTVRDCSKESTLTLRLVRD